MILDRRNKEIELLSTDECANVMVFKENLKNICTITEVIDWNKNCQKYQKTINKIFDFTDF